MAYNLIGNGKLNSATTGIYNVVINGFSNLSKGIFSFIGNGYYNKSQSNLSFIGNGYNNYTQYGPFISHQTIVNGTLNSATTNSFSTVVNGYQNNAYGLSSIIGNGQNNRASGNKSAIINGVANITSGQYSFIGNGINNTASGIHSAILNGSGNTISGPYSAIIGGQNINGSASNTVYMPNARLAETSGSIIYSAGTPLQNIFATTATADITRVQPGLNTYTGGTSNSPTVNISAATLNYLSASTISADTIIQQYDSTYKVIKNVYYYQSTSAGNAFIPLKSMSTNSVCYIKAIGTTKQTGVGPAVLGGSSEATLKRGLLGNASVVGSTVSNINTDGTNLDFYITASGTSAGILLSADTGTFDWLFNYELIYY